MQKKMQLASILIAIYFSDAYIVEVAEAIITERYPYKIILQRFEGSNQEKLY